MSVLGLDRHDIEKAVKQYYRDYENDLYKQFDFDNFELWVDNARKGYTGVENVVRERTPETLPNNNGTQSKEAPDVK